MGRVYWNWSHNQSCEPVRVFEPESVEELSAIMREAKSQGQSALATGSMHSQSDLVNTPGYRISLDKMNRVLSVDHETGLVQVEAGLRLRHAIQQLAEIGLSLSFMGSVSEQSIAGASCTGTHSSCASRQVLASIIKDLEIVAHDGTVHTISAESHPEWFDAVRLARGEFGVITKVTIQCEPKTYAVERLQVMPLADMNRDLESLKSHDHFRFFWKPGSSRSYVQVIDKLPPGTGRAPSMLRRIWKRISWSTWVFHSLFLWLPRRTVQQQDRSDRLFLYPRPFVLMGGLVNRLVGGRKSMLNLEYGIPTEQWPAACEALSKAAHDREIDTKYPMEIRFGAADSIWLSPAYGRDTCYLGYYAEDREGTLERFRKVHELLRPFDPRPHWGKLHFFTPEDCERTFPRWKDYLAVRREFTGEPSEGAN